MGSVKRAVLIHSILDGALPLVIRENNQAIYDALTSLGVPQETVLRFLIVYRFKSIRNFSRHNKISHTSVLAALKGGHPQVREIIEHNLF